MGKIFYIMGKSSSGKDTIYNRLRTDETLELSKLILYTTRPMREGEMQGREYHFVQEERFCRLKEDGKVIESRTYETVYGPWTYFTADDGQIADDEKNYLGIGTLESYMQLKNYYGEEKICPIYIEVEDGERLKRAIAREEQQKLPKYENVPGDRPFNFQKKSYGRQALQRDFIIRSWKIV